jgi:O-antigen ligase
MVMSRADWPARVERWRELAIFALVLAGAAALPLLFRRDPEDMFRLPKLIALRAEAILIVFVTLASLLLGAPMPRIKWRETWVLLPLTVMAIFVVITLTSTNRALSVSALASAAATAIVFFATVSAARSRGWFLAAAPLAAAVVNAILTIIEETKLWMPFGEHSNIPHHVQCNALIGNPNELGGYLGIAALAAIAIVATRRWGARSIAVASILVVALLFSQTLTAIVAFAAAFFCMMALSSWRHARRAAAIGTAVAVLLIALVAPFRVRAIYTMYWIRTGSFNAAATERFTPFVAAWSMFSEYPLTGVGPGAFAWQFFDHKLAAERRFPSLRETFNRGVNYGEVHNDHLQALAEGGVIGYAAFLALLAALGWISFTVPRDVLDPHLRFARQLALPLAIFCAVFSIAQFPMETTVVRSLLVHFAALCIGWRRL